VLKTLLALTLFVGCTAAADAPRNNSLRGDEVVCAMKGGPVFVIAQGIGDCAYYQELLEAAIKFDTHEFPFADEDSLRTRVRDLVIIVYPVDLNPGGVCGPGTAACTDVERGIMYLNRSGCAMSHELLHVWEASEGINLPYNAGHVHWEDALGKDPREATGKCPKHLRVWDTVYKRWACKDSWMEASFDFMWRWTVIYLSRYPSHTP
jgi:hypothetical protein